MCAGPEKTNHEAFWNSLYHEVHGVLRTKNGQLQPFLAYSKEHKKDVLLHVATGLFIHDQPERGSVANLLAGKANLHPFFGLSCDFSKIDKPFEACNGCVARLKEYARAANFATPFDARCDECLCWCVDRLCSEARYRERIKEIPNLEEHEHGYQLQFKPHRLSFLQIAEAWDLAVDKYAEQQTWSQKDLKDYLYLFVVSHKMWSMP